MTARILSHEDVYLRVYRRVVSGWVFITGDRNALEVFEDGIYPPGTHKNADLEMIMGMHGYFFIGKKTPELRSFLKLNDDPHGWASLFALSVHEAGEGISCATRHFRNMDDRERLLEELTAKMVQFVNEGGEP